MNYQLVLCEKPSVAMSIAKVICNNKMKRSDGYVEGNGYIVSWCVGHLVELVSPEVYDEKFKKWSKDTLPIIPEEWKYQIKAATSKQFTVIKKLLARKDVEAVICATDAGREGELIFRLVYEQAGCKKPIKRLWISSMEEKAIADGFAHLKDGSEYENLYQSALCRQRADWLIGMNGTRLFTTLYGGRVLKVGRVQTPTLAMLVERELAIQAFKKEPFYQVELDLCTPEKPESHMYALSEKYKEESEAKKCCSDCKDETGVVVSVTKEEKSMAPPKLFDLTSLQREANKMFGYTAKETLDTTQALYEKKLVTYPRTDSQYLSDDMAATASAVIHAVRDTMALVPKQCDIAYNCGEIPKIINSAKVTDHHAIIPTVEIKNSNPAELTEKENHILNLIASRILQATGNKHIYLKTTAQISCSGYLFSLSGKEVTENGWKDFEDVLKIHCSVGKKEEDSDAEEMDSVLPELYKDQELQVSQAKVKQGTTKPSAHYTESTILSAMEKAGASETNDDAERKGLGTPATRADVLEKLVKDGYVRREKKQLIATEDGINLIRILPEIVKSPQLTADWENTLSLVSKGGYPAKDFMEGIVLMVESLIDEDYHIKAEDKELFKKDFKQFQKPAQTYKSYQKSNTKNHTR